MGASVEGAGTATILAIGTANPPNIIYQAEFADLCISLTSINNENIPTQIKAKLKRICEKTMIEKRYVHLTLEILMENPELLAYMAPSLNKRQAIAIKEVPKLASEAAQNAINEWGRPISEITHLIMCTNSGIDMPGADYQLAKLLGLEGVKRFMLYYQGCHGAGIALRLAKDLAENNKGARVLVVCSENTVSAFRGPCMTDMDSIVGLVIFGDGAGASIVGAHPNLLVENPIFELVWADQTIIPNSEGALEGYLREEGLIPHLREDIPHLISENIETCLIKAFSPLHIHDWNSIFWVAHPGGPAILDQIEEKLHLQKDKLRASRRVLNDYGNMSSATLMFVLDEMRKNSLKHDKKTSGEGLDFGVLFGFGPGITVETIVLRAMPTTK